MLVHPQGCREATSTVEDLDVVVHCVGSYKDFDKAQKAMECQYEDHMPLDGLSPEWADLSYIDETDAILHANGEAVHVWEIITMEDC